MADPRYEEPVGGFSPEQLPEVMRAAMKELERRFPGSGVALFVMDYGQGGGLSYISNVQRDDMANVVVEWLAKQRSN